MHSTFRGEQLKTIDRISIGRGTRYEVKKWRFPLTTVCPVPTCRQSCRSRENAINHYKNQHADASVLCTVCVKPYSSDVFVSHFIAAHPGYYLPRPKLRGITAIATTSRDSNARKQSNQKYIVTLSDGNVWAFPRITWCPHRSCNKKFENRQNAMNHYIERHVPTLVLCTLCEPHKPITISVIPRHYAIGHSGAQVPADWKDQMKQECEVCHQMLSSWQSYLKHKATQHHIGKYKCPHNECEHTESERFQIKTHWKKCHAHMSMKSLYHMAEVYPFESDTKKQVRPSPVMKRKRARRVTRSTTESWVTSTSDETDSAIETPSDGSDSNVSDVNVRRFKAAQKKTKRISIIDDPKLFLTSSVQLTRLSSSNRTVQSIAAENEPEPTATAATPSNVQINNSAQTSMTSVQSIVQPLLHSEPQAGSSQNVNESVFIKTEQPDYLEDVTIINDEDDDDIIDLSSSDDDEIIYISN